MVCLQSTSFSVLINGSPSNFFRPTRGLRQGCPLSPFIFLLVAEALSRIIHKAKSEGAIKGIKVSDTEEVTHSLFVDDVLLFGEGNIRNLEAFIALIDKYRKATGMVLNMDKSNLIHNYFLKDMLQRTCRGQGKFCNTKPLLLGKVSSIWDLYRNEIVTHIKIGSVYSKR